MPIRESEKARYPADWKAISATVRAEAGNCCEWCRAPNGETIRRGITPDGVTVWRAFGWTAYENGLCADTGTEVPDTTPDTVNYAKSVRIVLTVAHLDHQPENCARDNLKALCQRCHLRYDAKHHARNSCATRQSRKAVGDLFAAAQAQKGGE